MAHIAIHETNGNRTSHNSNVMACPTSDDQYIGVIAGDVEITLHISEALDLSSALESLVKQKLAKLERELEQLEAMQ